ncbi:dihydrolipoamide dehydrogenase [Thermoanaerobacter kivui]|uniref:Dihydrolipoamide dehydrogenase n=1 Tax=Thermoanaerobacter kivui TaxID=2325 RepID=A0A097ANR2_THEKI|nr:dihydrolipoamide dehydrogenase [Thermoanaerobacter kivui]
MIKYIQTKLLIIVVFYFIKFSPSPLGGRLLNEILLVGKTAKRDEFGVKVSVVEMMPDIFPTLDKEVSSFIRTVAQRRGIKIYTSSTVERIDEEENGRSIVTVKNGENIKRIYTSNSLPGGCRCRSFKKSSLLPSHQGRSYYGSC